MYPLTNVAPVREVNYLTFKSPIKGTSFEQIVTNLYTTLPGRQKVCISGPVQQVSSKIDSVTQTGSCKNVDTFLT